MIRTLIFTLITICSINTLLSQSNDQSIFDKNFRVSLDAGFGYRTGPLANDLDTEEKAHIKRLLTGFNLEGHFSYFLKSNLGLGLTYNLSST